MEQTITKVFSEALSQCLSWLSDPVTCESLFLLLTKAGHKCSTRLDPLYIASGTCDTYKREEIVLLQSKLQIQFQKLNLFHNFYICRFLDIIEKYINSAALISFPWWAKSLSNLWQDYSCNMFIKHSIQWIILIMVSNKTY